MVCEILMRSFPINFEEIMPGSKFYRAKMEVHLGRVSKTKKGYSYQMLWQAQDGQWSKPYKTLEGCEIAMKRELRRLS
jgi:hypothetical protein